MSTSTPKTPARAHAVAAVRAALAARPEGRALAGELEALLGEQGVSSRQARRWMRWATTEGVVRLPKRPAGTLYCLPGCEPPPPAPAAPLVPPAPELAGVPADLRRDVALALSALLAAGGELEARELAWRVAAAAGRPVAWARGAVDAAAGCARRILRQRWGADGDTVFWVATPLEETALAAWAAPPVFVPPGDPGALARRAARLAGAPLAGAEVEVLAALAALGGAATVEELYAHDYVDRRAATAVVAGLREARPAWVVIEGLRRVRLARELWHGAAG